MELSVNGPWLGRESAIRAVQIGRLRANLICDVTSIPTYGCRPPKRRRV